MQSISTIGLDIAKTVFQVHGVDAVGQMLAEADCPWNDNVIDGWRDQ